MMMKYNFVKKTLSIALVLTASAVLVNSSVVVQENENNNINVQQLTDVFFNTVVTSVQKENNNNNNVRQQQFIVDDEKEEEYIPSNQQRRELFNFGWLLYHIGHHPCLPHEKHCSSGGSGSDDDDGSGSGSATSYYDYDGDNEESSGGSVTQEEGSNVIANGGYSETSLFSMYMIGIAALAAGVALYAVILGQKTQKLSNSVGSGSKDLFSNNSGNYVDAKTALTTDGQDDTTIGVEMAPPRPASADV